MDFYFIGDEELVTAFRFIGINGITVSNSIDTVAVFRQITEGIKAEGLALDESLPDTNNCQVLILTEETADWLGNYAIEWQLSGQYPLLVEIPGIEGRLTGRKTLVDAIREAIGIRV